MWRNVAGHLEARGWTVQVATRFCLDADTLVAAQADWAAFCRSTLAVVDVRGPEVAPGAALMIGACTATGRSVLAGYSAGWQTLRGRARTELAEPDDPVCRTGRFTRTSMSSSH